MKALDIMTKDVVTIASEATIAEAIQLMQERGWRSLIVDRADQQDAYGILTETDITCKVTTLGKDPQQIRVKEVMTKPCIVVNPDLSVENVAKLFANNRLLRAPVIQGELLGIISLSDILARGNMAERLDQTMPDQNVQALVQQVRSSELKDSAGSSHNAEAWDEIEEKLLQLSQEHAEHMIKTALKEYFEAFADLRDAKTLDNFCSG